MKIFNSTKEDHNEVILNPSVHRGQFACFYFTVGAQEAKPLLAYPSRTPPVTVVRSCEFVYCDQMGPPS